jgi:hypothetical protein
MEELVQIHAKVPRQLKRRLYTALAWREETYVVWLQRQMEGWLAQIERDTPAEEAVERQEASHV